jgi:hypothetical protein
MAIAWEYRGDLLGDLIAGPRQVRQVSGDILARLIGVDVIDVRRGHRAD